VRCAISYLYINDNNLRYAGLFGYIFGGSVSNLGVHGSVSGGDNVGGVAGWSSGTISNCEVYVQVSGNNDVGGVAGYSGGSISNCYSTGAVNGNNSVGGVAGQDNIGNISNCYSTGAVNGNDLVGGVAGELSSSKISNCYATGAVSGNNRVGGLAGRNYYSTVEYCVALNPSITRKTGSTGTAFGRVAGEFVPGTFNANRAWSGMEAKGGITFGTGAADNKDGIGVTTATVKNITLYNTTLNWSIGASPAIWQWGGTSYPLPILQWQNFAPDFPSHLN
jgi:hypothetical protein